jgi:hypothetical protein
MKRSRRLLEHQLVVGAHSDAHGPSSAEILDLVADLGISVMPREDNKGAQIKEVAPNRAMVGLHPCDFSNSVNSSPVKAPIELTNLLSRIAPGTG